MGARIEITREGGLFRLAVTPADALPVNWARPETFASAPLARLGARILADATGLPIVDLAKAG